MVNFIFKGVFSSSTVCKNTLEPGDTNTDEHCKGNKKRKKNCDVQFTLNAVGSCVSQIILLISECDSCAQTLLHDLEKLDDELGRIKGQLDNATASASSQDKLKSLEKAMSDTKVTCHSPETLFSSSEVDKTFEIKIIFKFKLCRS